LFVKVSRSPLHGQGCFTTCAVAAGERVAESRLLMFPPGDTALLLQTNLKNYLFFVKDGEPADGPFYSALAMGPVSFCNHSGDPNCAFHLDEAAAAITLVALRDLGANEEIRIDYGDYAEEIV
jgi:hypothetical protein